MLGVDKSHHHETMEQIKVRVTLDGDLAATLQNAVLFAADNGDLPKILFCEHVLPKLNKFMTDVENELNIEERKEK